MVGKRLSPDTFAHFTEKLQAHGRYTFTKKEAIRELGISDNAFRKAAFRLSQQKRLMRIVNNFYVIVPFEYHLSGGLPATSYIDDLMKFQKQPYYVGVLSAASLHGAAHQAPQELQVVTSSPLRVIHAGRSRIRFLTKKRIGNMPTQQIKTPTGYITVSTPEATAYDLLLYARSAGHLNNIATVLIELSEVINPQKLLGVAKTGVDLSVVCRAGYLLDQYAQKKCTTPLYSWIKKQLSAYVLLQPNSKSSLQERNEKWKVIVNEKVEPDL